MAEAGQRTNPGQRPQPRGSRETKYADRIQDRGWDEVGSRRSATRRSHGGRLAVAAAPQLRLALDGARGRQRFGALEYCRPAEPADAAARAAGGGDAVEALAGGISLLAPGVGYPDGAQQSDTHRAVAGADLFPDAAGGQFDLPDGRGAVSARASGCARSRNAGSAASASLHAEVCPGKRSAALSRTAVGPASGAGRRGSHAGGGAGLHSFGVEDGISDWGRAVSALSGDRSGGGGRDHVDWHDATAAGDHFDSAEDSAVCHGGWLEPAGGVVDEKFCLRRGSWGRIRS